MNAKEIKLKSYEKLTNVFLNRTEAKEKLARFGSMVLDGMADCDLANDEIITMNHLVLTAFQAKVIDSPFSFHCGYEPGIKEAIEELTK